MKSTFFYLRDKHGHPIGVLAMRKVANGVRVAGSLCAATDEWDKHTGVAKAVGRLDSKTASRTLTAHLSLSHLLRGLFYNGWCCDRADDVDLERSGPTWDAQYDRLTTPPPSTRAPAAADLEALGQGIAS